MANSATNIDTISSSQAGKEITANSFFDAASQAATYGRRASTSSGLTWGYYGGNVVKNDSTLVQIANDLLTLTANATNYVVASKATGVVSSSTTITNWNDTVNYWRLYSVVTGAASVASYTDSRAPAQYQGGGGTAGDLVSPLVNAEVSITGAVTLDGTAFGKMHVCSGTTADYTVGLPAVAGNGGKLIGLRMSGGLTKIVTLDGNASETINGQLTRRMMANEVSILLCDGTSWSVLSRGEKVTLTFSGSKISPNQSIAPNTATKITFETEDFDVGGGYNPATSVFTVPANGAGKWIFGAALIYTATSADDTLSIRLYKNGVQIANIGYSGSARVTSPTVSGITVVDVASGDTIEIYGFLATTSGNRDVIGASGTTRFFGYKVD